MEVTEDDLMTVRTLSRILGKSFKTTKKYIYLAKHPMIRIVGKYHCYKLGAIAIAKAVLKDSTEAIERIKNER